MTFENPKPLEPEQSPNPSKNDLFARIVMYSIVGGLFAAAALIYQHRVSALPHPGQTNQSGIAVTGSSAPDFRLVRVDADSTQTGSLAGFEGHPLWVNFFATWCPPCKAEMPEIERRYLSHKNDGLQVVGADQQETADLVRNFARAYGLTFPLVIDQGDGALAYGVTALPTSVFIDSNGIVRAIYRGQMSPGEMDDAVKSIHS